MYKVQSFNHYFVALLKNGVDISELGKFTQGAHCFIKTYLALTESGSIAWFFIYCQIYYVVLRSSSTLKYRYLFSQYGCFNGFQVTHIEYHIPHVYLNTHVFTDYSSYFHEREFDARSAPHWRSQNLLHGAAGRVGCGDTPNNVQSPLILQMRAKALKKIVTYRYQLIRHIHYRFRL